MAGTPNKRVSARATGVVGIAILCSRILGLVREMVIASLFGATRNLDAFLTAFRAPNMLRDLFAEGALVHRVRHDIFETDHNATARNRRGLWQTKSRRSPLFS